MSQAPDSLIPDALIQVEDVAVTLPSLAGPVEILRGVSLAVEKGETLGLVGPSGSGKSTLLMVLAGLEQPTGGTIAIAGKTLNGMSEDDLAVFRRENIGIVFQSFHLIPTMTALENVAVPIELARQKGAFARAQDALKAVGLDHRLDHYPSQLSGGEQQRVALARALVMRPKVLLADEPTGNLDQTTGEQIIELLFSLHERFETTLFLITHDEGLAARCGRVLKMADGLITVAKEGA
jgi:putative ABC transport system ATP-binding protein